MHAENVVLIKLNQLIILWCIHLTLMVSYYYYYLERLLVANTQLFKHLKHSVEINAIAFTKMNYEQ